MNIDQKRLALIADILKNADDSTLEFLAEAKLTDMYADASESEIDAVLAEQTLNAV